MEKIKQFWMLVLDIWETGIWGIDLGRIIIAVLIFIGFLLIRRLFTRIVIHRIKALTERTKSRLDDDALAVLEKPLGFIPIVIGAFIATEYLPLSGTVEVLADKLLRSLIVFVLFWGLVNLVRPLSYVVRRLEEILTTSMVDWLIKAISLGLIFIGAATILEIWGIRIGPILAGLGLFGVAVALGAQDLFKNLISGILIIAERRFNVGDWIRVDGVVEGTVESIGFRSTFVRRFDMAPVFIPNSKLSDNAVTNFSAMIYRRIYWLIGVEYRTTVEQLRIIRTNIEKYILESDAFVSPADAATFVRIDSFNDSSIDILVYCFTKTKAWGEWLLEKEKLAYEIKQIVEAAGTAFAFPSQSLYIESMPSERAEVFIPPSASTENKK